MEQGFRNLGLELLVHHLSLLINRLLHAPSELLHFVVDAGAILIPLDISNLGHSSQFLRRLSLLLFKVPLGSDRQSFVVSHLSLQILHLQLIRKHHTLFFNFNGSSSFGVSSLLSFRHF